MNNSKTKYEWINGIKGIACLIVATNHIHNLFPEVKLPSAICNGQFMVSVFILLSILLSWNSGLVEEDGQPGGSAARPSAGSFRCHLCSRRE